MIDAKPGSARSQTPVSETPVMSAEPSVMSSGLSFQVPRLDEPAPAFEAQSTKGLCRLEEYRGQWVLLFAHPADFTPVCTSEFVSFAKRQETFKELNCALLGLSVDSVYAHLAWIESMQRSFDITVDFPIIEDVSMAIAASYGMIHPSSISTATIRSVFFIDPNGILRAMMHYPLTVGRSVEELLRVLQALQHGDANSMATPEGWKPGEHMLAPPPTTLEAMEVAVQNDNTTSWYYQEREHPVKGAGK